MNSLSLKSTAVLLGALSLVAGCGSDKSPSPAAEATTPTALAGPSSSAPQDDPCDGATGSITVYSGRSESLVADLYTQFTNDTGVKVEARFGDSGELAGQLLTEGSATPADVFFSQDAGALGAVSGGGLFGALSTNTLDRVAAQFRSTDGTWVGTSGRVRVVIYNPTLAPTPPVTVDELLDPQWKNKIGYAPTNASWQSFVTALRVLRGDDGARTWLEAFAANEPVAYEKNGAVRDAVNGGEVALGLVNHYYLFELIAAEGAAVAKNQFMSAGDPGGLVNVAGVGVLGNTDNAGAANCFASYLVSTPAQEYFVNKTFEYPLIEGVVQAEGLPSLAELQPPALDLADLNTIAETQELLSDVGLLTK